jgi:DNA-binding response OmpR family regulator
MGLNNMKALILEENRKVVELYEKIFLEKKYEAEFVFDHTSCLDRFEKDNQRYDFVILEGPTEIQHDYNLEDKIRNASPEQRVLFLSPYLSMRKDGFESLKETLDLIDKPFAMISLLSGIEIRNL